jgi:hypothetical protein
MRDQIGLLKKLIGLVPWGFLKLASKKAGLKRV